MTKTKKLVVIIIIVGVLATAVTAFAATVKSPAEVLATLTGKTVEEVFEKREEGKTFGAMAMDAGKFEEFKQKMLELKKSILDQRVKDGELSKEKADEIYSAIKENQANCDGTGNTAFGRKGGMGFGRGNGMGNGRGMGRSYRGMGRGIHR